ncbi:MAG: type II toxin-antitoxin system HipA family toxin YjjJ [Gammaproteobacteria bacterium]
MATKLRQYLSGRGAVPAGELREALETSPATLSRLISAEQGAVLTLSRGRATHYALPRPVSGLAVRIPVYRLDSDGRATEAAALIPLQDGGSWIEPQHGSGHAHVGLPPVVHDMAPAGYLGRRFAAVNPDLALPARLQDWNDDHRLIAVARRGEDCPGDLILGEESLRRLLASQPENVSAEDYPRLADRSAAGGAGSSAAGEQPKFTAFRAGPHCLVKFTPGDASPSDLRWRDLLACEAIALDTLREAGIAAAQARTVDMGNRRFLEVQRFDRIGARGRRGVLTLGPLDDDLFGRRDSWSEAAARFNAARLLASDDARRIRLLEAFGMLIANSDRHFGNLSFFADGLQERPRLLLAPAYDMLPMAAAPVAGHLPDLPAAPAAPEPKLLEVWDEGVRLAQEFWRRVTADLRISEPFRRMAAERTTLA